MVIFSNFYEVILNSILIYGGSFDPIHNGHLKTALAVQQHIHVQRVLFLPCKTPVLKEKTVASTEQRLHMLQLALKPYPTFEIDPREIKRDSPSYMVETLQSFRQELGKTAAINLLMGMDAFMQLPQWYHWEEIIQLANLVIISRKIIGRLEISTTLQALLSTNETLDKSELLNHPCGKIYRYDAGNYPISSTLIREQLNNGRNISDYVPPSVYQYIQEQALYCRS